jgi:hypothetical protein
MMKSMRTILMACLLCVQCGLTAAEPTLTPLILKVPGVTKAERISGTKTSLWVHFGEQGGIDFSAVAHLLHAELEGSPVIPEAVFLIGHGGGVTIAGTAIDQHLRVNKAFYETFGGLRKAKPLACVVIASCSPGAPDQMQAMRNGLGYYPTWRVGTWSRSLASPQSVLGAFAGIANRPAKPAWRGLFLTARADGSPASLGEVGIDGERGNLTYIDLIRDGNNVTWKPR